MKLIIKKNIFRNQESESIAFQHHFFYLNQIHYTALYI
jgi:hypothetical protein